MNISEAIATGKPFKRPSMNYHVFLNEKTAEFEILEHPGESLDLTCVAVFDSLFICDDWEVEPEPVPKKKAVLFEYLIQFKEIVDSAWMHRLDTADKISQIDLTQWNIHFTNRTFEVEE